MGENKVMHEFVVQDKENSKLIAATNTVEAITAFIEYYYGNTTYTRGLEVTRLVSINKEEK